MPKGTLDTRLSFFGVPFLIHWSAAFLLILFLSFDLVGGLWKMIILLGSLLFHEYGHVYAAKKLGYAPGYVMLHGAGAFAYINQDINFYKSAKDTAVIAGAGPLASLVLWLSSWMVYFISTLLLGPTWFDVVLRWTVGMNFLFAAFNLLPLYPSDGGRLLHALALVCIKPPSRALTWAVNIGLVFVGAITITMLFFGQFWVVFVALLLGYLAIREKRQVVPLLQWDERNSR